MNGQTNLTQSLQSSQQVLGQLNTQIGELQGTNKQMLTLGTDVKRLQEILSSPKLRGQLGEWSLKNLLETTLPKDSYELQYAFKDNKIVDALVKLASFCVPIDAKFPLPAFEAIAKAQSDDERIRARRQFQKDVTSHIDKIAASYIRPAEGTVDFAVAEQRRLLEAALTPEILEEIRNLARLVIIVMAAGSLAYDELHLPTWRVASLEAHNSLDSFLINLMLRDQLGLSEPEKQETLARFVAGLYAPTAKLAVQETTTAICASLEEARRNGWSVCQFTRDAIRQGSDLFKQHIDRAEALLEETGSPAVQCVESVFGEARLMPLHQRKDNDAWSAMVRWMQQTHNDAAGSKEMDGALLVLAYADMFLFWFGILREKSRAERFDATRSISTNN